LLLICEITIFKRKELVGSDADASSLRKVKKRHDASRFICLTLNYQPTNMADFISANCADCSDLEFRSYTFSCDVSDADLQALGFTICGQSVDCLTQEADFSTLQGNNQFVVIQGVSGSKADPTPSEIDLSAYSCYPTRLVKEYDEVLNFTVPFLKENWLFWNQVRKNPTIASQGMYVTRSGIVFEIPATPTVFVSIGAENGIQVVSGSVEWTTTVLEEPFDALANIWQC
jgi:hypothetical protein